MKTIEQHKPFDKFHESRGKIYAVVEQTTKTLEDSEDVIYVAKCIETTAQKKDEAVKNYKLDNIIATLQDGIKFYGNSASRSDISDAIEIAKEQGATDQDTVLWKTVDGIKEVTLLQLKTARKLALEEKANIIGVQ